MNFGFETLPIDSLTNGLQEDCYYGDITTEILGISGTGRFQFISRVDGFVSGTSRLKKFFTDNNLFTGSIREHGSIITPGDVIIEATGDLKTLFKLWRICQTYLTIQCAITTQTKKIVQAAKNVNPAIRIVVSTRKAHLGMRIDEMQAIMDGGALYHRNSLSDTILITQNHLRVLENSLPKDLYSLQHKLELEPSSLQEAYQYAKSVDIMVLDHFELSTIEKAVYELKALNPRLQIGVAGDISLDTVSNYAKYVDIILLSSVLYATPLDITCRITRE